MSNYDKELLALGVFGRGSRLTSRIEVLLKRGREISPRASMALVVVSAVTLLAFALAGSFAPHWIAYAQRLEFEVASVKPSGPSGEQFRIGSWPGGRFTATDANLKRLIQTAYDVRSHQISGGPNWLESAKFDIEAKADAATPIPPGSAGAQQIRSMVQSLLEERFKLSVHRETREEQVYELVVAKGGAKLTQATESLNASQTGLRIAGRGRLIGIAAPLPILINVLSEQMGRLVTDKTGLMGRYDFTLEWTPDPVELPGIGDSGPPPPADRPSLFTAIQEQLGLKLESTKGPVEILVIDHAEKPDAN
jgi:uncharacterized protein (TIGR03435 family)